MPFMARDLGSGGAQGDDLGDLAHVQRISPWFELRIARIRTANGEFIAVPSNCPLVSRLTHTPQCLHDALIPLSSRSLAEDPFDLVPIHPLSIRAIGIHRIVGVGHGDDAGHERDIVTLEAVRVTGPVHVLMMAADACQHGLELPHAPQDVEPDLRVLLNVAPFLGAKAAGLAEHGIADTDLADIV